MNFLYLVQVIFVALSCHMCTAQTNVTFSENIKLYLSAEQTFTALCNIVSTINVKNVTFLFGSNQFFIPMQSCDVKNSTVDYNYTCSMSVVIANISNLNGTAGCDAFDANQLVSSNRVPYIIFPPPSIWLNELNNIVENAPFNVTCNTTETSWINPSMRFIVPTKSYSLPLNCTTIYGQNGGKLYTCMRSVVNGFDRTYNMKSAVCAFQTNTPINTTVSSKESGISILFGSKTVSFGSSSPLIMYEATTFVSTFYIPETTYINLFIFFQINKTAIPISCINSTGENFGLNYTCSYSLSAESVTKSLNNLYVTVTVFDATSYDVISSNTIQISVLSPTTLLSTTQRSTFFPTVTTQEASMTTLISSVSSTQLILANNFSLTSSQSTQSPTPSNSSTSATTLPSTIVSAITVSSVHANQSNITTVSSPTSSQSTERVTISSIPAISQTDSSVSSTQSNTTTTASSTQSNTTTTASSNLSTNLTGSSIPSTQSNISTAPTVSSPTSSQSTATEISSSIPATTLSSVSSTQSNTTATTSLANSTLSTTTPTISSNLSTTLTGSSVPSTQSVTSIISSTQFPTSPSFTQANSSGSSTFSSQVFTISTSPRSFSIFKMKAALKNHQGDLKFQPDLKNSQSDTYKAFAQIVRDMVNQSLNQVGSLKSSNFTCSNIQFFQGSVIFTVDIVFMPATLYSDSQLLNFISSVQNSNSAYSFYNSQIVSNTNLCDVMATLACDKSATCTSLPGSYSCNCNNGFKDISTSGQPGSLCQAIAVNNLALGLGLGAGGLILILLVAIFIKLKLTRKRSGRRTLGMLGSNSKEYTNLAFYGVDEDRTIL